MGCVFSRHFGENNLKIFHVWNVDEQGNHLNQGKIEVTRSDLILHQKSKAPIKWPLRSLRRYGFDAELFSFESGRRCPTGPGIYAFKCRQAECLFNVLQECIQNSGATGVGGASSIVGSPTTDERLGSVSGPVSGLNLGAHVSQPIAMTPLVLSVDTVGYLEPISSSSAVAAAAAATVASSSQSRASISSASTLVPAVILEPLSAISPARGSLPGPYNGPQSVPNPVNVCNCPACTALGRTSVPHYINEEVFNSVAATTNTRPNTVCLPHQYVNSNVLLGEKPQRNSLGSSASQLVAETSFTQPDSSSNNLYMNGQLPPVPWNNPPQTAPISYVDQNTNYARLEDLLKQEQQHSAKRQKDTSRFYVNVTPDSVSSNNVGLPKGSRNTPTMSRSNTVTSPTGFLVPKSPTIHFYANLNSPPAVASSSSSTLVNDTTTTNGTDEFEPDYNHLGDNEPQVNYITLDLNHPQPPLEICDPASSPPGHGQIQALPSPPTSYPYNNAEGYATIDFDKTAALSNSVNPGIMDDSIRKTRHNSSIPALP